MLAHVLKKAREQEIFSRDDTPIEQRVLANFLYHAGLSFRRIEPFVDVCHVAVHDWYHRLKHLFEPDRDRRKAVAVNETKLEIEDEKVYVWTAVEVGTFEVLHVDVSPGQPSLDALLFLKEALKYCRGQPAPPADRGSTSVLLSETTTHQGSIDRARHQRAALRTCLHQQLPRRTPLRL